MGGNPKVLLIQGCGVAAIGVFLLGMAAVPRVAVADFERRDRIIAANPSIAIADPGGQAGSGFRSRGFPSKAPTRVTQSHKPGQDAHAIQVAQEPAETPRKLELLKRLIEGLTGPRAPQDPGDAQPPAEPGQGQAQPPAEPGQGQAQPPAEPGDAQPPPAAARVVSRAEAVEILTRLKYFHDRKLIDSEEYEESQIRVISSIDFQAMGAKDGLRFLRGLRKQRLINKTVYEAKKQEILAALTGPGSSPQAQPPSAQQTPPSDPTATASPAARLTSEANTDRPGHEYMSFELRQPDPAACMAMCAREAQCKAYTYVKPRQGALARCYLKSGVARAQHNNCCVSGVKRAADPS